MTPSDAPTAGPSAPARPSSGLTPQADLTAAATRVILRPLATPLPLGFLGLFVATMLVSGLQFGWVPASQGKVLALGILVLTVPVQLIACVYGFLVRDLVAGTGMGLLAGSWGTIGLTLLLSPPGARSSGLALVLVMGAAALLVPAVAASQAKVLAAVVIFGTATRFAVTAVYEFGAGSTWETVAGVVGVVLAAIALYAALAFEVEDQGRHTVLPVFRRGSGLEAMQGDLAAQVAHAANEAGVRKQL